jgi:hypothetical protein
MPSPIYHNVVNVIVKKGVFWDVTPCGCEEIFLRSVRRLLVAACAVPSSPILVTLMKEAPSSCETSVLTRATRRNIPEDTILHSHSRENLKSYSVIVGFHIWRSPSIFMDVAMLEHSTFGNEIMYCYIYFFIYIWGCS